MRQYMVEKELAKGSFSTILLCKDKTTQQLVIVKQIQRQHGKLALENVKMEQRVHKALTRKHNHANIVKLIDTFYDSGYDHLVMEYCVNGELYNELDRQPFKRFEPLRAQDYFVQIADAVSFVHDRGFAHRDISLENVFLDQYNQCKLGDFGFALPLDTTRRSNVGKSFYMPPEMFLGTEYALDKADVWALGIILFMLLTGGPLVKQADSTDAAFRYFAIHGLEAICKGWQIDRLIPSLALDLLNKMLCIDPKVRIGMDQVMKHAYVVNGIQLHQPIPEPVKGRSKWKELAKAINGQVLLCTEKKTKRIVVIKCVKWTPTRSRRSLDYQRPMFESCATEKLVHSKVTSKEQHPHIVNLFKTFTNNGCNHFVLEYCSNGELFRHVQRQPEHRLQPQIAQEYFAQIAHALLFIHDHGFAHGDLSLENIFLDAQMRCKVGDFGLAVPLNTLKYTGVGKFFYMAPEIFQRGGYHPGKADIWALGIVLFVMLTGSPLFQKAHKSDAVFAYYQLHGLQEIVSKWEITSYFSSLALDLLSKMLIITPEHRISINSILQHPYVAQCPVVTSEPKRSTFHLFFKTFFSRRRSH
ncbi:kinase [Thraustotheca clavata]|uniref:Kinase n=1 Tax=Thraustotheca clavata TaxID=74557 RepID=A0A1W0AB16_9STRA|nr:kinase [Thraustotheca clavata]